jgi:hypothetical protein
VERAVTRIAVAEQLGVASIGLLSAALVWLPVGHYSFFLAGFAYCLNGVVYGFGARRRRALLRPT